MVEPALPSRSFRSSAFPLPPQRPTVNHSLPPVNDLEGISSGLFLLLIDVFVAQNRNPGAGGPTSPLAPLSSDRRVVSSAVAAYRRINTGPTR